MSNRKVNPDSLRQVTRYINEYSQHIWDNELTGDKEFVRVKENNKLKTVRSRSKDGKYYYEGEEPDNSVVGKRIFKYKEGKLVKQQFKPY